MKLPTRENLWKGFSQLNEQCDFTTHVSMLEALHMVDKKIGTFVNVTNALMPRGGGFGEHTDMEKANCFGQLNSRTNKLGEPFPRQRFLS